MTTRVNCSADMRQALNENFDGLLTGKRKPMIVKEVNNTLGKMLTDVKMEMMQNALVGSRAMISWFDIKLPLRRLNNGKAKKNGVTKHLK